ncbi:MAG: alpha/beta hydrolase [Leptospiraceae bacterium]|nr:alpha/beta hydrolase [Leptospiraceae bacterium]MDW7976337.1 alpha/beta fold hydrolase [Leptospiraceae bacterium]
MQKNQESVISLFFAFLVIILLILLSGSITIALIVGLFTYFLFLPLSYPLIRKKLHRSDLADKIFFARTEDNWYLPLHYHEARYPRKKALPVILVHGIAQNKYALDLDEFHSLAVFLKVRGFPVFVVSLRGSGLAFFKGSKQKGKYFTFDDHVLYDAPAIIRKVIELTEAPAVNWVGFSLGGMIGYGICGMGLPESKKIQTLITLGSPGKADYINNKVLQHVIQHPWINKLVPLRSGSRLISPLGKFLFTPMDRFLYNPENTKRKTIKDLLANCIEPINQGIIDQFSLWAKTKQELSLDKTINYRKNLENIKIPTLLIAGSVDHVVPVSQIRFVYETIKSPNKKFVIAGKRYQFKEDYGHLCLSVGEYAPEEIFPIILNWLETHGMEKPKIIRTWIQRWKRKRELKKVLKQSIKSNRQQNSFENK